MIALVEPRVAAALAVWLLLLVGVCLAYSVRSARNERGTR